MSGTIDDIIGRLRVPGTVFKSVEGGLELADVVDTAPKADSAAYVLLARETAGENERVTGPVMQRLERDVMVVVAIRRAGTDKKAQADQVTTAIRWVLEQLIGFVPSDMNEPLTYVAGELVEVRAGCAWYQLTFSAPIYLMETN